MFGAKRVNRKRAPTRAANLRRFLAKEQTRRENASAGEVAEWSNAAVLKALGQATLTRCFCASSRLAVGCRSCSLVADPNMAGWQSGRLHLT